MKKEKAIKLISDFYDNKLSQYDKYNSPHEAWGVIREEYLEFEQAVMRYKGHPNELKPIKSEAIDLAGVAIRVLTDLIDE